VSTFHPRSAGESTASQTARGAKAPRPEFPVGLIASDWMKLARPRLNPASTVPSELSRAMHWRDCPLTLPKQAPNQNVPSLWIARA